MKTFCNKSRWNLLLFIATSIFFASCAFHYASSPQYIPLNEKKGELKINQEVNSLQIGCSLFDHFSIFTTGWIFSGSSSSTLFTKENGGGYSKYGQGYEINFGSSYFYKYNIVIYEILAGFGYGELRYENSRDLDINYKFKLYTPKLDLFIQPDIGIRPNKNIELGICSRFSYQRFYDIQTTTDFGSNDVYETRDRYFDNKSNMNLIFWEPAFSLKLGTEKFKVTMLFGKTQNINDKHIIYQRNYFNIGFFLNFDLMKSE
jgi:hypothetical protein